MECTPQLMDIVAKKEQLREVLFFFLETGCNHVAQAGQLSTLLASTSQALGLWGYDASLCHVTFNGYFKTAFY